SFGGNQLNISGFVLLGLSSSPEFQGPLFCVFLLMYLLSFLGNILIFFLIFSSSRLFYSPMYFFLSHLSLADLGFSSTTLPKMLQNLVSRSNTISYSGCLTQMYFLMMFGTTDNFLLASMAYDRYVAICHPLHYVSIMSYKCCLILASAAWLLSHIQSLLYVLLFADFSFCASREIPHFFCDLHPLLKLSCSDISSVEMLLVTEGTATLLGPLLFIFFSYTFIVFKVLKIPSTSGKYRAFSTCSSHLTTVAFFYGTLIGTNICPSSTYAGSRLKVASIFYSVVTPMLNPVIYSLRNREIHGAMKKFLQVCFQKG
uniref:Olfactory receptor n=1 Tax=Salvator merianae TaxID=96440 RepID=A0A8D0E2V7_SALMN